MRRKIGEVKMYLNKSALEKLIQAHKNDRDSLDMIYDVLKGFEEYHAKIIEMEIKIKLFPAGTLDREEYQYMITELDKHRTMQHDSVLTGVNILNRMAERENIDPIYNGKVSKERPYRREVANAVLDFIQDIIVNRR